MSPDLKMNWPALSSIMGKAENFKAGDVVLIKSPLHSFKTGFGLTLISQFSRYRPLYDDTTIVIFPFGEIHENIWRCLSNINSANKAHSTSKVGETAVDNRSILLRNAYPAKPLSPEKIIEKLQQIDVEISGSVRCVFVDNIEYSFNCGIGKWDTETITPGIQELINFAKRKEIALFLSITDDDKFRTDEKVKRKELEPLVELFDHCFSLDIETFPVYETLRYDANLCIRNEKYPDLNAVKCRFSENGVIEDGS